MTNPTTMRERVETYMRDLEARHHKAGWDQSSPLLIRVTDGPLGLTGDEVDLTTFSGNPREALEMLVMVFNARGREALLRDEARWGMAPPVAHVFITETYMRNEDTDPEAWTDRTEQETLDELRRKYGTTCFADIPGSIEGRMVLAVFGDGELALLQRTRFQEPILSTEDESVKMGGAVTDALRTIHSLHAGAGASS